MDVTVWFNVDCIELKHLAFVISVACINYTYVTVLNGSIYVHAKKILDILMLCPRQRGLN